MPIRLPRVRLISNRNNKNAMLKFIQYVCLLFLVCSCSTRNEESVILQNETDMEKKNLGSVLALYPKPMTVVGAVVNGK